MNGKNDTPGFDVLFFNPFLRFSGAPLLITGLIAIILAAIIGSFSDAQFNAVLNVQVIGLIKPPLYYLITLNILNWLISTLFFLVLGGILSKTKFRIIDIVSTQAFARWPNIMAALAPLIMKVPGFGTTITAVYIVQCSAYLCLSLMVALMYNSYKVSFDLKGGRLVASFIIGLFLAQTVSLVLTYNILQKIW
ncbi:MAG: hypothetical protein JW927_20495 [Deltaproteobacteria bacterium]|nr:hypothetical protein [Deltaproteobacteria bacterium]